MSRRRRARRRARRAAGSSRVSVGARQRRGAGGLVGVGGVRLRSAACRGRQRPVPGPARAGAPGALGERRTILLAVAARKPAARTSRAACGRVGSRGAARGRRRTAAPMPRAARSDRAAVHPGRPPEPLGERRTIPPRGGGPGTSAVPRTATRPAAASTRLRSHPAPRRSSGSAGRGWPRSATRRRQVPVPVTAEAARNAAGRPRAMGFPGT